MAVIRRYFNLLSAGCVVVASLPYLYFTFLNVDPLHDGWFTAPAVQIAEGGLPYKDVVTSYGWVSPVILSLISRILGFHLIFPRLFGLLLLFGISFLLFVILRRLVSFRWACGLLSMWLMINLGQSSKSPSSLPAWGFWPNQLLVLISLLGIFFLISRQSLSYSKIVLIGILAGISPWIRAQGMLTLVALLFVFLVHLSRREELSGGRKRLLLIGTTTFAFFLPLMLIIFTGSFHNFIWQTVEMPRTGEWVGMPKPLPWILQNIGLASMFAISVILFGVLLTKFKSASRYVVFVLAPILYLVWKHPFEVGERSGNLIFGKLQSITFLYSNYYFFTFSLLVLLAIFLVYSLYLVTIFFQNNRRIKDDLAFQIFCLSAPAVTLIYYNFGHVWGVTPLILIPLIYSLQEFLPRSVALAPTIRLLLIYSVTVSILATPQVYGRVFQQSFSYSAPGLELMRGHDANQVHQVREALRTISQIPRNQKVFFLCESALYSIIGDRYISDNIFYSTSMTKFERRPSLYREPKLETQYLVYCPGSYTLTVDEIPGTWTLASFSPDPGTSTLVVYKRS